MKKVSFITVNYKNHSGLEKTLESLEKVKNIQSENIEIIVVDGGSGDQDMLVIEKFKPIIDRLICEPDDGVYDAMNKGIKISSGSLLCFMNSGDTPIIENMLKLIQESDIKYWSYGNGCWTRKLRAFTTKRISRFWCKMPNHQAMLIPRSWHFDNLYDLRYPIAADLDMKLKLYDDVPHKYYDIDVVLSEPGGMSQSFGSTSILKKRATEIFMIALRRNNLLSAVVNYLKYLSWHYITKIMLK